MDICMPEMDWIETTKAIKTIANINKAKITSIIWLTATLADNIEEKEVFDFIMEKPIKLNEIIDYLREHGN